MYGKKKMTGGLGQYAKAKIADRMMARPGAMKPAMPAKPQVDTFVMRDPANEQGKMGMKPGGVMPPKGKPYGRS